MPRVVLLPNAMPWVKGYADERVNDAIEAVKEEEGCNKTEATENLLRLGADAWEGIGDD